MCNMKMMELPFTQITAASCGPATEALERATKRPRTSMMSQAATEKVSFALDALFDAVVSAEDENAFSFPTISWEESDSEEEDQQDTVAPLLAAAGRKRSRTTNSNNMMVRSKSFKKGLHSMNASMNTMKNESTMIASTCKPLSPLRNALSCTQSNVTTKNNHFAMPSLLASERTTTTMKYHPRAA